MHCPEQCLEFSGQASDGTCHVLHFIPLHMSDAFCLPVCAGNTALASVLGRLLLGHDAVICGQAACGGLFPQLDLGCGPLL